MTNINKNNPCFIDLHLHLDGSISLHTARRLAAQQGISVPDSDEELSAMLTLTPDCKTLDDYLSRFKFACSLLRTREALITAAHDLMARLKEQGIIYAEVRFAPQKSLGKGLSQSDAVEAVLEGMRSVDLPSGLLLSMMRGKDTREENIETVLLTERYLGHGVVGLDLAGAETVFPTKDYEELFLMAREKNIPFTIHAGEGRGAESVAQAVSFGAVRIGHGVRSVEDETMIRTLLEKGITLELCPTSNLNTNMFESYEAYPFRQLLSAGVKVTLNTDNMTVSDVTIADEWEHICKAFRLSRAEVRQILINSVDASFASDEVKESLLCQIESAYPQVFIEEIKDLDEAEVERLAVELPAWRADKMRAYFHFQSRKESVVSFRLLQKALKEVFDMDEDIAFEFNEHGKPLLAGHQNIHFNISHCKQAVAVAVSTSPIGVDVESFGRYREMVARHVLNEDEMTAVLGSENPDETFTALWTRKEAVLKLVGTGVSTFMKNVLIEHYDKKITTTICDGYAFSVAE